MSVQVDTRPFVYIAKTSRLVRSNNRDFSSGQRRANNIVQPVQLQFGRRGEAIAISERLIGLTNTATVTIDMNVRAIASPLQFTPQCEASLWDALLLPSRSNRILPIPPQPCGMNRRESMPAAVAVIRT
jgi:hypothetical protein